jgi:hypothetical protein
MSQNVAFLAPVRRDHLELDLQAWLECYLADCEARGLSPRTLEWYRDRGSRMVVHLAALGVRYPSGRYPEGCLGALRQAPQAAASGEAPRAADDPRLLATREGVPHVPDRREHAPWPQSVRPVREAEGA